MKQLSKTLALFSLIFFGNQNINAQEIPRLEKRGQATQLIVDGKPFLVLGGELHNSSSSELNYLNPLWAPLKQMNLNTALVAVSWELIEPQEGKFDFTLVDGILKGARENKMRVVLLWFGSWKNGLSHYAPEWVKKDYKRFPRIVLENGKPTETLSALSTESANADAKAFAALMRHVKVVDGLKKTVIMVQVQNEVGVIGGTRDHSAFANSEFKKQVPTALLESLGKNKNELQPSLKKLWEGTGSKISGNWNEVFGNGFAADEAFMAWNYATYVNTVTKAGKAEYNIPMFVNAWIVQPEDKKPGDYPGGGPQAHVHDIWRAG
ncbi:MAG: beta-galactosidase, partial [Pyrinomonadaceae bacterium]|nr:beta-galactosidase [Sphingobacteriaceae bacterium]